LSGAEISDPDIRLRTYQTVLTILMRFLLTPQSASRGKDADSARKLKSAIIGRVLADTSIAFVARMQLWTLCWQIDRGLAAAMLPGMLFNAVVDRFG
jgi:hypothetical protein